MVAGPDPAAITFELAVCAEMVFLELPVTEQVRRIADFGERAGVTFCLENLNTAVDHPGVPFARAADTLALERFRAAFTTGATAPAGT